jgi:hypothetical protein
MSAEELRNRVASKLGEARDTAAAYSLNARFRPSTYGEKYIPAVTAEEIALQVLEGNAMTRAYTLALEIVNESYRQMFQPDDDKKPEQEKKEMY